MSFTPKKLVKGDQPPLNGWETRGMREVKVTVCTDSPLVNIPVGKHQKLLTWLIDSGASESILDEISFKEHFPEEKLKPMPLELNFKSADGSPLNMIGFFTTSFKIGNVEKAVDIFICKGVERTRLLGNSLLSKFSKWGINNANSTFVADGESVPLVHLNGKAPKMSEVKLYENVDIPPRCSQFVKAVLPQHHLPTEFVFQPSDKIFQRRKLLMPVCLVASSIYDGSVTIKITNPNNDSRYLGKGTKLGKVTSNLQDFVFSEKEDGQDVNINLVQQGISNNERLELEEVLRKENPDLFKLYTEAGDIIKGTERIQLLKLLYKHRKVFSKDDTDIGTTTILKHRITPKSDKIVYRRQYKLSEEQQKQMDQEVDNLLKSGVIKESMSPFNNPVLMVPKKEPGKWRFCLDCRYINDLTEDQYFPIPRIDDAMDSLSGSSIFSVVDMTSGYHQVDLEEESSEMCAFSTRKGHFQYTKLPMGLRGSGMTFQKMVTLLMAGMLHTEVLAYLDDCILYGTSISQHLRTLEEVLSRFGNAGLKLKPRKCKLFQEELVYLGFLVNKKGIGPNPERTKIIRELPEPTSVRDVQVFLGKVNYYRKFIPNLAQIAHPLYELTENKGRTRFLWEEVHRTAFNKLKSILCSCQVMSHPRFDREFILDVDASDFALGIELSQKDDYGRERPVFYGSRHLEKSERNYSATARETLAAVFGCEYFSQYLQGRKFTLRTDHNPLVWLRSMKEPKRPYSGWIVRLEQFHYKIEYRPGNKHTNADFNSRIQPPLEGNSMRSIGIQVGSYNHTPQVVDTPSNKALLCVCTNQYQSSNKESTFQANAPRKHYEHQEIRPCTNAPEKYEQQVKRSYTNAPEKQYGQQDPGSSAKAPNERYGPKDKLRDNGSELQPERVNGSYANAPEIKPKNENVKSYADVGKEWSHHGSPIVKTENAPEAVDSPTRLYDSAPILQSKFVSEGIGPLPGNERIVNEVKQSKDNPLSKDEEECPEVVMPEEFLAKLQNEDEDIGPVMKMMKNPEVKYDLSTIGKRLWKIKRMLKIKGEVLFRYRRIHAGLEPFEQIILPKCLKNMVLESLHDSEFSGHFGTKRTLARVQIRYYWPGYSKDIEEWCKSCLVCQERKNPPSKNISPLTNIDTGTGPFEQIALDILKLPVTERGNEYILLIEDYFSKWIEAFPLKRTIAPSVAQCLLNGWISRFGCPCTILSDQGSEFESKLFKCLNDMLGIKKLRTTAYHPRTDGMVERSNRTVIDILSKYTQNEPDWDLRLPLVLFAIRTSDHATTGFSPFKLIYGREARLPWDLVYGLAPNNEPLPREEWVAKRKRDMVKVFDIAKRHTLKRQHHQKNFYDKHKRGKFYEFAEGEQIMLCDPAVRAKAGKLNKPWSGPFIVKDKLSPALYKIILENGKEIIVNAERLKKFYARRGTVDADSDQTIETDSESDDEDFNKPQDIAPNPVAEEDNGVPEEDIVIPQENQGPPQNEPLMGHDGRYWCNVDPANILRGNRRTDTM